MVTVIGAGLAGCEAAYQIAKRDIRVKLVEMKPAAYSPAHTSPDFAELVCSNSLRSDRLQNAVGLLKEEMRRIGSLIMAAADKTRVPAGGSLAVDREGFSRLVSETIRNHPNIELVSREADTVPDGPVIIATGPLTAGAMYKELERLTGESAHFFDAAAPIVTCESLDMTKIFRASRYGRGDDYLNCPMTREEYFAFYHALVEAETVQLKDFEHAKVFEGCMPVETMARRGELTLAYGPLKPVGLKDPLTDRRPFAVVQLRQDDAQGEMFNIVGFQTNLKFGEQKRVFGMIPGLENAQFVRYGVMHRNTFITSPGKLDVYYRLISQPQIAFAGQITGVEGYVESASSGMAAGINMARALRGEAPVDFTRETATGALCHYIAHYAGRDFQPMNVNFGIMEPLENAPKNKQDRYLAISERALARIEQLKATYGI